MSTPSTTVRPSPKRKAKFAIGGLAALAIVVALIVWAMNQSGSQAFFKTVSELTQGETLRTADYRVNGNVVADSLERDGVHTSFAITDGTEQLRIETQEALPDAFWTAYENDPEGVEIIAQGRYDGRTFTAHQVLAKCPSKFKAKV
ncbi:MAG: cytochrome c maturation protein CcmE [Actinomycetota bacterium]|nr:cytochrome c maturation protein CcmE [Actinomycetota bacterium]